MALFTFVYGFLSFLVW
uniref:Uncharacterized protein n=1 Tax=Triatoma infestans TaxID=30076 RepID=A0A170UBA2_TRIIF